MMNKKKNHTNLDKSGKHFQYMSIIDQNDSELKRFGLKLKESEHQFITLLKMSHDGLLITRQSDGLIWEVNNSALKLLEYDRKEVIGHRETDLNIYKDHSDRININETFNKNGFVKDLEIKLKTKTGNIKYVLSSVEEIRLNSRKCFLTCFKDITEQKKVNETPFVLDKNFDSIIDQSIVGIAQTNLNGNLNLVNDCFSNMIGYSRRELLNKQMKDIVFAEDFRQFDKLFKKLIETGEASEFLTRYIRKNGEFIWVENSISLQRDAYGKPLYVISFLLYVTQSRKAQKDIKQWADALENTTQAIAIEYPANNNFILCNSAFAELLGHSTDEVIGMSSLSIYKPEYHKYIASKIEECDQSGKVSFEAKMQKKNRKSFSVQVDMVNVYEENGKLLYRVKTIKDITQNKKIEESLQKKNELLGQSFDAIIVWDLNDGIISWNKNAENLYGYTAEEAISINIHALLNTVFPKPIQEFFVDLKKHKHWQGEIFHTAKDGREILVKSRMSLVKQYNGASVIIETCRDITKQKAIETELMRAFQLSLVGEMAAGLAHEIKNPLAGIKGVMDILIQDLDKADKKYEIMHHSLHQIERIDLTVKELLSRSRFRPVHFEKTSLNETINRAVQVAYYQTFLQEKDHKRNIIKLDLPDNPIIVPHDASQIEDAVLNLIINAKEYIDKKDGEISVKLSCKETKKGYKAVIEVSDNGCGISEENLPKIFTPFFTTSKDGTGLGLSAVRRIINAHNGTCKVYTKVGEGTRFLLLLPIETMSMK